MNRRTWERMVGEPFRWWHLAVLVAAMIFGWHLAASLWGDLRGWMEAVRGGIGR